MFRFIIRCVSAWGEGYEALFVKIGLVSSCHVIFDCYEAMATDCVRKTTNMHIGKIACPRTAQGGTYLLKKKNASRCLTYSLKIMFSLCSRQSHP